MSSEDFKSFCRALIPSGVGSIPTRSRQRRRFAALVVVALGLVGLAPGPLVAQPREPASGEALTPAARQAEPFRPSATGAMLRSAALPGWGQLYNRRWIKGLLFAAGRIYFAGRAVEEHRLAGDLEEEAFALEDEDERAGRWRARNRAINRRDDFIWYSAYAWLFTLAEAFVDASLMGFDEEFDEPDAGGGTDRVYRLGYSIRF